MEAAGLTTPAFAGLAALTLAAALACAAPAAAKTLTVCTEASPEGFDYSLFSAGNTADAASEALYNRLVEFEHGSTRLVPALAERWDISADGRTYTFHLRAGVAFHTTPWFKPTRPLNADDVVYSFMRQLDPAHPWHGQARRGWFFAGALQLAPLIKRVSAVDARTVRIELTRPEAPFLADVAMGFLSVLSSEYAQQLQRAGRMDDMNLKPVGTGPFMFRSYAKDAIVRYDAHPAYFRGKVALDRLIFSISPEPATRLQRLKAGECDVALYPAPQTWDEIRRDARLRLLTGPELVTSYVALNLTHPPLDDRRVRQALLLATDRAAIVRAIYGGAALAAVNPYPPSQWSHDDSAGPLPQDLSRARELLKSAGLAGGFALKLWIRSGAGSANPNPRGTAELLQADWARIGVKAEIVMLEFGELLKRTQAGAHDAAMLAWSSDNGDPDNFLAPNFGCAGIASGSNTSRWCRQDVDALLAQARATTDQPRREVIYRQLQALYRDDVPWVPLVYPASAIATSARVTGMKISPFSLNNYATVDLK